MGRLGVLGWPVSHSRSPAMFAAAFTARGLGDWRYQLLPVPPELFAETARALGAAGFAGANVTIPHKVAALELAREATPRAREIGAANTLTFGRDGTIHADNTDAPGLMAALARTPATALVLGAGGSARAAAWALREAGSAVRVWGRTSANAQKLAAELGIEVMNGQADADVVVNCTPVGLHDPSKTFKELPLSADLLREYATVVDLVYRRDGDTALVAEARRQGCEVIDGLEILVRQGAMSFEAWIGQEAPLDAMREGARGGRADQPDDLGSPAATSSARSHRGSTRP